jgi:hypothetical protein
MNSGPISLAGGVMEGVHVSPVSVTAVAANAGVFIMHHAITPANNAKTTAAIVTTIFP